MPLLHGPDGDDEAAADAQNSCQLPQRSHPPLCRREVMDYSHGEHGVETVVPKWQGQVITEQHLQARQNVMLRLQREVDKLALLPSCDLVLPIVLSVLWD